jgi:hypothetical protein
VRDGVVLRAPRQEALYIVVNAPNERIRVRYLHMLPRQFDADGMLSGRAVREGEVIGKVGNFFKRERATTYHLHFDLQVPTKYGWVFVNPYMTLVASYERLIQARGQEIKEQDIREDVHEMAIEKTTVSLSKLPTVSDHKAQELSLLPRPRPGSLPRANLANRRTTVARPALLFPLSPRFETGRRDARTGHHKVSFDAPERQSSHP